MSDTLERLREQLENYDPPARHTGLDYEQQKLLLNIAEAAQGWIYWYENGGSASKALAGIKESLAALDSTGEERG